MEGLWNPLNEFLNKLGNDGQLNQKQSNIQNGTDKPPNSVGDNSSSSQENSTPDVLSKTDENSVLTVTDQNGISNGQLESTENAESTETLTPEKESLTHSLPPLSDSSLSLPVCPAPYLEMSFDNSIQLVGFMVPV